MKVTKAIIAVAGYGTRRLPVTKSIEKCMLPLLNRPIIDYVVEDCAKAGITDIYFVVSGPATQLRDYFARDIELEQRLERAGKTDLIKQVQPPEGVTFHYVEQDMNDPRYGTTVPVWLCREYVASDEHAIVIYGDQYLYREEGSFVQELIDLAKTSGTDGALIGIPVPKDAAQYYGLFEVDEKGKFKGIIEHPGPEDKVADIKNVGIYLVDKLLFDLAEQQINAPANSRGEYYLTDVVSEYIASGKSMEIMQSDALYIDCGTLETWVESNVELLKLQNKTT